MRIPRRLPILILLGTSTLLPAATLRRSVVMAVGEQTVYQTASPIATVSTPPGTPQVVTYSPEQYGNSITLKAVKKGEVKLLVESTQQKIAEVVNVVSTDKTVAARYRFVSGSLTGIEGLQPADFVTGTNSVIVGGTLYSTRDLQRCRALDTSLAKPNAKVPTTFCVARLNSAVPAVSRDFGYDPSANVTFSEAPMPGPAGAIEGSEGESNWTAVVRMGDIPVLELASRDRANLFVRAAQFAAKINKIAAEWRVGAEKGFPYPVTFSIKGTPTGYDVTAQWKFDQGTRGESLIHLTPDDLQQATGRSGGGVERMLQWWAALTQDGFRMYFMASLPVKSLAGQESLLKTLYHEAVALHGAQLDRASSATEVARATAAHRWASGHDPFDGILTTIPVDFQPAPVSR